MTDDKFKINVFLAIELPFWIPIESGEFSLSSRKSFNLHNDYWLISVGNIVDGPPDSPHDFIVNELQVDNHEFIQRIAGADAAYFHKRKLKTTFTRPLSIIPNMKLITAPMGTEKWMEQITRIVFGLTKKDTYSEMMEDINAFIDLYSMLISPLNPSREVRRVSFYDSSVRVLISVKTDKALYLHTTSTAPDIRMADVPSPHFRVRTIGDSDRVREVMQIHEGPQFHQIQWVKALNHNREKRFQEALLSAAITLETLIHLYIKAKGLGQRGKGIAPWIRDLAKKHKELSKECKDIADLWDLRNEIVHERRKIDEEEIQIIRTGIRSLTRVRAFFLDLIDSELLDLENQFSSFLEPIPFIAAGDSIKGMVSIRLEWRREADNYQTVYVGKDSAHSD